MKTSDEPTEGPKGQRPVVGIRPRLRGLLRRAAPRPAILVIDDQQSVRDVLQGMLQPAGFTVFTADSGQEALRIWERAGKRIRLVITDVVMLGMDGPETVLCLAGRGAAVPVLYISAYPRERIPHQDRHTAFIRKPFTVDDLLAQVHALLGDLNAPLGPLPREPGFDASGGR